MNNWNEVVEKIGTATHWMAYAVFLDIMKGNDKVRPIWTTGRGRFTRTANELSGLKIILERLEIPFVEGNDAPRGGKTGTFIEVSPGDVEDLRILWKEWSLKSQREYNRKFI